MKNMEKCEENTLKCDEDVSKSMKTGEEKRIVREMRPEDVPSVALLEAECFSEPWSEQAFSDALHQPVALMMVAEDTQQVPVGYCGIYLSLDEGEITDVAVRPECRKQGIADAILDTVFIEAQKRAAEKIYLEVRQSNIPEQQLYEKHGFESCGLRKNFYRKPTEHAIVMGCDMKRRIKACGRQVYYIGSAGERRFRRDIEGKRKTFFTLRRPGDIFPAKMEPGRRRISVNFAWNSG